jgi:hypothetical protein
MQQPGLGCLITCVITDRCLIRTVVNRQDVDRALLVGSDPDSA